MRQSLVPLGAFCGREDGEGGRDRNVLVFHSVWEAALCVFSLYIILGRGVFSWCHPVSLRGAVSPRGWVIDWQVGGNSRLQGTVTSGSWPLAGSCLSHLTFSFSRGISDSVQGCRFITCSAFAFCWLGIKGLTYPGLGTLLISSDGFLSLAGELPLSANEYVTCIFIITLRCCWLLSTAVRT